MKPLPVITWLAKIPPATLPPSIVVLAVLAPANTVQAPLPPDNTAADPPYVKLTVIVFVLVLFDNT